MHRNPEMTSDGWVSTFTRLSKGIREIRLSGASSQADRKAFAATFGKRLVQ
ncbi:MAG: hypothetical protein QM765_49355 [Myxococcales bacterium]